MRERTDLENRIINSSHLTAEQKSLFLVLADRPNPKPVALKEWMDYLMGSPYNWNPHEIVKTMNELNSKGLIKIAHFKNEPNSLNVEVYFTFTEFWFGKL